MSVDTMTKLFQYLYQKYSYKFNKSNEWHKYVVNHDQTNVAMFESNSISTKNLISKN